jgi:hypothetical protein
MKSACTWNENDVITSVHGVNVLLLQRILPPLTYKYCMCAVRCRKCVACATVRPCVGHIVLN